MEKPPNEAVIQDPSDAPPLPIRRFLALHHRERLFVHPFLWQERQPDLLGCRLTSPVESNADADSDAQSSSRTRPTEPQCTNSHRYRIELWRQGPAAILALSFSWREREIGLLGLLSLINSRPVNESKKIWLHFKGRPVASLPSLICPVSPPLDQQSLDPIIIACLDLDRVELERKNYLDPPADRLNRGNLPIHKRFLKLLKYHTPPDPYRDPYLTAVLIALAQKHSRNHARKGQGKAGSGFTSHLLVSSLSSQWLHHYTANVPPAFLERLDDPGAAPTSNSTMEIEHRRIPLGPYETLKNRVAEALGIEVQEIQDPPTNT